MNKWIRGVAVAVTLQASKALQQTEIAIHPYWDIFIPNNTCDFDKASVLLRPKVNSFSCLVKKLKLILNIVAFHVVIQ